MREGRESRCHVHMRQKKTVKTCLKYIQTFLQSKRECFYFKCSKIFNCSMHYLYNCSFLIITSDVCTLFLRSLFSHQIDIKQFKLTLVLQKTHIEKKWQGKEKAQRMYKLFFKLFFDSSCTYHSKWYIIINLYICNFIK